MMSFFCFCLAFFWILLPSTTAQSVHAAFNITALASRHGYSVIECWALSSTPIEAFSAINYELGRTANATWSVIEPRTTVGEAWAPAVQYGYLIDLSR
jgi:hypothetical protein